MSHEIYMEQALHLAQKGQWYTAPNPMVGAVLVHENTVIAEGYHRAYGQAHAEVECLLDAIEKGWFHAFEGVFSNPILADALQKYKQEHSDTATKQKTVNMADCVLYVTLEPCNHAGKTPPCTDAIIESGIKHVVIGLADPNPKASGGILKLQSHGIETSLGVLKNQCRLLLDDFFVWQEKKRPYLILKMACSLDGRIGPAHAHNTRLSGEESRKHLMELRANIGQAGGAVMVGSNTFLNDNPRLTARLDGVEKQPLAVIVSSKILDNFIEPKAQASCLAERPHQTCVYTSPAYATSPTAKALQAKGCSVRGVSHTPYNCLNLQEILEDLYREKKCPYVLCEGGARLGLSLLELGLADEVILYMAPVIFGDAQAKPVFMGHVVDTMKDVLRYQYTKTQRIGEDLHIYLKPERVCLQD